MADVIDGAKPIFEAFRPYFPYYVFIIDDDDIDDEEEGKPFVWCDEQFGPCADFHILKEGYQFRNPDAIWEWFYHNGGVMFCFKNETHAVEFKLNFG